MDYFGNSSRSLVVGIHRSCGRWSNPSLACYCGSSLADSIIDRSTSGLKNAACKDRQMRLKNIVAGACAGLVGGVAASVVMNIFQRELSRNFGGEQRRHGAQSQQIGTPGHGVAQYLEKLGAESRDDDAAERTANVVSIGLTGHHLNEREKDVGGTFFHYFFGATSGIIYTVDAECFPSLRFGWGLPFGTAVWLIADEAVVPALGLSKDAGEYKTSTHVYASTSHLVYGLTTDTVLRILRPLKDSR